MKKLETWLKRNLPEKGYVIVAEIYQEEGSECQRCGTSIKHEQELSHRFDDVSVKVGRKCGMQLSRPYTPKELEKRLRRDFIGEPDGMFNKRWIHSESKNYHRWKIDLTNGVCIFLQDHNGAWTAIFDMDTNYGTQIEYDKDPTDVYQLKKVAYSVYAKSLAETP